MILMTARMVKILLTAATLLVGIWMCRSQWSGKMKRRFAFLTILFALAANIVVSRLPPLTDEVTLTALGEKRENAEAAEVFFDGYTVDGHTYTAGKSLQVVKGKWFWCGERYLWRVETDSRKPLGMTRSITVRIPVGWNRTLDFYESQWCGFVEISEGGETQRVDTFQDYDMKVSIPIGRSETSALIWNQIRRLALFAVLLLAFFSLSIAIARFAVWKPERFQNWLSHNAGKMLYAAIALVAFCLMLRVAGNASLWADELVKIAIVKNDLWTAMQYCVDMQLIAPPLYTLCAWIWYQIVPFGERWLLLLSIIPTVIAVYVMGLIGEKLKGKSCGAIAACLLAFSMTIWGNVAFEFRNYAFVLVFSTLSLYCHIQKYKSGERKVWLIAYSVSLLGLAMSHYFGMLLCGLFFIADLYLYGVKQVTRRSAVSYTLPGTTSLLWLFLVYQTVLRYKGTEAIANWYPVPTLLSIEGLLRYLSGNYQFSFCLLLIGIACAIVNSRCMNPCRSDRVEIYQTFSLGAIVIVIGLLYIYGKYVNLKSTMWENRYFIILIPFVALLSALGVTSLFSDDNPAQKFCMRVSCVLIAMILVGNSLVAGGSCGVIWQPFREAADWLYMQSNEIFDPRTVIVTVSTDLLKDGWTEYYISRQDRRDPLNVVSQYGLTSEELLSYNRVYIQYTLGTISEWLQVALDTNYTLEADLPEIQMKVYARK